MYLDCYEIKPKKKQFVEFLFIISYRADYWISQTRKYCDFCKCWITDNKPSVEFHEKGRRHQANVQKRLRSITKHSGEVQIEKEKYDATIRRMESAAMAAYQKDVEVNADMTSVAINKKLVEDNLALSSSGGASTAGKITKLWNEAKGKDGKSYYFNIMTSERVWTAPKEGFASIKEQKEAADVEAQNQLKALEKYKQKEAIKTMQQIQKDEAEEKARIAREKLKERRVIEEVVPETCGPLLEPGKTEPYGKWQTVKEDAVVDYQLPEQYEYFELPIEAEPEPVLKEFKEKTIESLGDGNADVTFKKRKFNSGARRNTRQRLDSD